jgi:hypothetical protein
MTLVPSRFSLLLFVLAAHIAALVPLMDGARGKGRADTANAFPGWPTHYEGQSLTPLPLTSREDAFVRDFPGRVGRFSDGRREIILRWVNAPTRMLHPASDCLRGVGYAITPMPVRTNENGAAMSCFRAHKADAGLTVCELLHDEHGTTWPDVSAWYWSALFSQSPAPWWSITVAEAAAEITQPAQPRHR